MRMHLCILLIAAFCVLCNGQQRAPALQINKYELTLNAENGKDSFTGVLALSLSDDTSSPLTLDLGSELTIETCKYHVEGNNEVKDCTVDTLQNGKVEIKFPNGIGSKITITYEGKYTATGLYRENINGKNYYFASFANGGAAHVLPCIKTDNKIFSIKLTEKSGTQRETVDLSSNIGSIMDNGKVKLEDIVLVFGKFESIGSSTNPVIKMKAVESYTQEKLSATESFSNMVFQKLKEKFRSRETTNEKHIQQRIFPGFTVRDINGQYFTTQSVKNFILQDKMAAFREQCVRTDLIRHLSQHWFAPGDTSDKWLTTGLATFLSNYILDEWPAAEKDKKKFQAVDQMVVDDVQYRAFEADGFGSSVPLKEFNNRVTTYDGVLSDPILYSKGASIMRSLAAICGKEKFENFLSNYARQPNPRGDFKKFAETFKECFESVAVAEKFFESWHDLPGYPVVHVTTVNATAGTFKLSQESFRWEDRSTNQSKWNLKIYYKAPNGDLQQKWMSGESIELPANKTEWMIVNYNRNGYYRVNYDMKMWDAIISQLEKNHTQINEINRAQIIDDLFSFARSVANYSQPIPDYKMAFKLFKYLEQKERSYIPLKAAFNAIEYLDSALVGNEGHSNFRAHVKKILEELYKKYSLSSSHPEHVDKLLRREVVSWACKLGVQQCVISAEEYYMNITYSGFSTNNSELLSDVEDIIYCTVASFSRDRWLLLFQHLIAEENHEKALRYVKGLGCGKDANDLKRLLNSTVTTPKLKKYQFEIISSVLNGNPGNINVTLEFLKGTKPNTHILDKVIQLSLRKLSMADAKQLPSFIDTNLKDLSDERKKEAVRVANTIVMWNEKKTNDVIKALKSGESRTKPLTIIVALTALLPFLSYFSRC